jgi:DNA-binding transcriptional ArsR family regulator
MAIPRWLWSDTGFVDQKTQPSGESLRESEIEDAISLFSILSDTTRLEILASLHSQSDPISYTELRESTSVSDKGKFNYHLRQLEQFVQQQDGEYTLSERGEGLMRDVLSEEQISIGIQRRRN